MNIVEENNLVRTLPSLNVSAARERRRQKRLKALRTPDHRTSDHQVDKCEASPVWSISPISTLEDATSYHTKNGPDEFGSGPTMQTSVFTNAEQGSDSPAKEVPQEIDLQNNVSDILQVESDLGQSSENVEQTEGCTSNVAVSTESLKSVKKTKQKLKKTKHKKSKSILCKPTEDVTSNATTISAALNEIIDTVDIIDETRQPAPKPRTSMSRYSGKGGSEISLISDGRVFVQHGRNFTVAARDQAFCRRSSVRDNNSFQQSDTTALQMAVSYQKKFLPLSTLCHGLLAGIAIWQCVAVFQQNGNANTMAFVESYSKVARLFQSVFYMLGTVSCVAVLDRCVPSSFSWQGIWELLILQPCCLFALLASCGALLSSGIAIKLDDRLALHNVNETLWSDSEVSDDYLSEWLTTNLFRCILAVVSYVIISLCWGDNSSALPFPEISASVKPSSSVT